MAAEVRVEIPAEAVATNGGGAVRRDRPTDPGSRRFSALSGRAPRWHRLAEVAVKLMAFTSIAAVVLVFLFVAREAYPLFIGNRFHDEVTIPKMLFAQAWPGYDEPVHDWQPVGEIPKYGIVPLLVGTLKVTLVSLLLAVPLAVAAAVYVSQLAGPTVREYVKPAIELLAGIPSVVLGFFALISMATVFQRAFGFDMRLNAVVAGAALAIAIIPVVFTIAEDAITAVPRSFVEASEALGARRWQTVVRAVVPAASPGIAAAVALGVGRAFGETMVVLMASGNAAIVSWTLADSVRTIPATIASELAEVVFGEGHYTVLFALGAFLFVVTAGVNYAGDRMISRMRARMGTA